MARAILARPSTLEKNGIPAIQGIDTRALTKKLRVRGVLNGFIATEDIAPEEAVARARSWPGLGAMDYVKMVTHREPFLWDEKDAQSGPFLLPRGSNNAAPPCPLPPADIPIVAYDFGMKYNILRRLRQHGFKVQVVPATTAAAQALHYKPAGIFLSNGPGDPSVLDYAVQAVSDLIQSGVPIFGICLGPPDCRPGLWRQNLQTQVRPSRRQSAGQKPRQRQGRNHLAKPRLRRRSRRPCRTMS